MKFFLLSDNIDTRMGLRLAGIEGVVVHEKHETLEALDRAMADPQIGIILMTEKLIRLCAETVYDYKLHRRTPLIVEIPDRHGSGDSGSIIAEYIKDAIGITI
ncbi:V-type ATP synthase subunit F [Intestinibacillus massiliensis]|nr:V-type ATP synthase subunit F [Intestinibacillus massiliensis]